MRWLKSLFKRRRDCARDYEIALKIVECFDHVDFSRQTFTINQGFGPQLEIKAKGENCFYLAGEVDKSHSKINALIEELTRGRPIRNSHPPKVKENA